MSHSTTSHSGATATAGNRAPRRVAVIGGTRYFGRHLVTLLRDAGAEVTLVNRGSAPPPPGVDHVLADRDDEDALTAALGDRTFDAVIDQVLYTPAQAAVARRVFADRTPRYVMTSTMEVYDPATSPLVRTTPGVPVSEEAVDPAHWPVDLDLPWHDPAALVRHFGGEATSYAEGKRQAEAVLAAGEPPFGWASVRSAHVLGGGALDFTGRLAHFTGAVAAGRPVAVHERPQPTSFVRHEEIAAALVAVAASSSVGAVNAASAEPIDAVALSELIAGQLGTTARYRPAEGADHAPFSFDRWYPMDTRRAGSLGLSFSPLGSWLPAAVGEAAAATTAEAGATVEVAATITTTTTTVKDV
ncbi:NAD-dependent epimerase/dehydratase family protein [Kitasatospora purpeofusca]|uniref:NAD-dependent epimerase/dehydratase family protein n=1 Tax=Kitasatospora purpeofusca TaxID=67352 RepID=UPI002A5A62C0|nr:NAD-dependent epimerase/dehydratase family protein [Kitasatospora purpeofusca]MDY0814352.1 NAD-dependent epimerase/dehydratase family protein [Kitasatospora purpeofusca]